MPDVTIRTKPLPRKQRVLNRGYLYSRSSDDNVKNPLGFICNRVSKLIGSDEQYTLENQEGSIEEQEEEFGLED